MRPTAWTGPFSGGGTAPAARYRPAPSIADDRRPGGSRRSRRGTAARSASGRATRCTRDRAARSRRATSPTYRPNVDDAPRRVARRRTGGAERRPARASRRRSRRPTDERPVVQSRDTVSGRSGPGAPAAPDGAPRLTPTPSCGRRAPARPTCRSASAPSASSPRAADRTPPAWSDRRSTPRPR